MKRIFSVALRAFCCWLKGSQLLDKNLTFERCYRRLFSTLMSFFKMHFNSIEPFYIFLCQATKEPTDLIFSWFLGGISIQSEKSNNCLVCLLSTKLSQVFCFSGAWKCEGLVLCLVGSPSSLLITLQSFNPSSQVKVAQDFACRNAIHLWLPYCCSSSNVTPHNLRYILLIFFAHARLECLEYIKS